MNLLSEAILMEFAPSDELDYLEEYLIVSGGINIDEARSLTHLLKQKLVLLVQKLKVKLFQRYKNWKIDGQVWLQKLELLEHILLQKLEN